MGRFRRRWRRFLKFRIRSWFHDNRPVRMKYMVYGEKFGKPMYYESYELARKMADVYRFLGARVKRLRKPFWAKRDINRR